MKSIIFVLTICSLSLCFAADIPVITTPSELARGEYAEGTVTRMSEAEVNEFRPWASNAKSVLTRALSQIKNMPLGDRATYLKTTIQSVVVQSGTRQYQTLMRFALNRGMLLLDEFERLVPATELGQTESGLDILLASVRSSLSFYESDLNFQERVQAGLASTDIPYATFAANFSLNLVPSVLNVMNAKAQYRLMYKLVEMLTWDLSRDANAAAYAEIITEAYDLLKGLPEESRLDDRQTLRLTRKLNALGLSTLSSKVASVPTIVPIPVVKTPQEIAEECALKISNIRYAHDSDWGTFRAFCLSDTSGRLATCTENLTSSNPYRPGALGVLEAASVCLKNNDAPFVSCVLSLDDVKFGIKDGKTLILGRDTAAVVCGSNSSSNYVNCVTSLASQRYLGEDAPITCLRHNSPEYVACKVRGDTGCDRLSFNKSVHRYNL